jgi:Domain of unknown function (DUF6305)
MGMMRRKYDMRTMLRGALIVGLILTIGLVGFAQEDEGIQLLFPVLTTSAGQSADVNTLNILMEEAALLYDYCDVPSLELVEAGVGLGGAEAGAGFHVELYTDLEAYPEGTAYATVAIAIGASLKGMGASGLTVDDEVNRVSEIIAYCQENEIAIIGLHLGGESARGAAGGDNETMIDAVAPFVDVLIVTADGNKDGRFTAIAEETGAVLYEVENALAAIDVLQALFTQE